MASERLSPGEFGATVTAITNAFGDPTRRAIYLFASEAERGVTASEAAERFELHPNVARHHLDKLAGGGYLDVAVDRAAGGAGRPSKRYRAAERQALALPRPDDLVHQLLSRALELLPPAAAQTMAEEVGRDYGRALAGAMSPAEGQRSFRTALRSVADALTAHGFAARTEQRDGRLRLVSEHCPFGDTAIEHPVICAVDRGLVRGMLESLYGETSPEHEATLPAGGRHCVTAFE